MLSSQTKARAALLALCATAGLVCCTTVRAAEEPAHPAALDDAIIAAAKRHGVPEHLVRRIIMRESKYNPKARNHKYWGLMQISYPTARSMGFKGTPGELLDPVVNLRYAVPYLANAFVIAGKSEDAAVRLYAAGYYFTARSRGLLAALRTAESIPLSGVADEPSATPVLTANASAQAPESMGVFGALFSPGRDVAPQQQVVSSGDAAAPAQPQPASSEANTAPAGTFTRPNVAMVVGTSGEASPPKKWKRDGGLSLIARGEQGLDKVAAREAGQDAAVETGSRSHRHAHKITLVASLDTPPSSAQAYAAPAGQDPRFAATASQAAIAQATAGQTVAPQVDAFGQPVGLPTAAAPQPGTSPAALPTPTVTPTVAEDDKPKHRPRHAHRHKSKSDTQIAESKTTSASAPPLRTTATQ